MHPEKNLFIEIFNSIDFHRIQDHPNILVAASFWEEERYCAARMCYQLMRAIDDMIDDHKAKNRRIAEKDRENFKASVDEWLKMIIVSQECNPHQDELSRMVSKFRIPMWPLQAFAKSMIYDINNDGFPTLASFLEYSQGASVAPASIFVHLNGIGKNDGSFTDPPFDVKWAATPCAIFSYIVHIIRDFQKDQLNNLSYFADDIIFQNGLTREDLRLFANGRPVDGRFRKMIEHYYILADEYRQKTWEVIKEIKPLLEPRYQLSLEIIFNLYLLVFERIDLATGTFTSEELNPTPDETRERVFRTIFEFTA
jgi:phytoene/squalene synthetase